MAEFLRKLWREDERRMTMAENKYICQSCFHKGMCLEYDDECYGCPHYVNAADVAPRSEVAREIFGEIERIHDECIYIDPVSNIGSLKVLKFERMLEELKQKYTEEQK